MSDNISPEEQTLLRDIKQREASINQFFRQLQLKKTDILSSQTQEGASGEASGGKGQAHDVYLDKYRNYSISSIKKNYEAALPGLKWYQLPFCRRVVYQKMLFCLPANVAILATYMIWKKIGDTRCAGMYVGLTALTWAAVLAESLVLEPYCDIKSQHYNEKLSNIELAKQLKKQYQQFYPSKK